VLAIVVAQEFQGVTGARNRSPPPGAVSYEFVSEQRRVNAYCCYIDDREFGPGFVKTCSYFSSSCSAAGQALNDKSAGVCNAAECDSASARFAG
jgi:hypothetical protein